MNALRIHWYSGSRTGLANSRRQLAIRNINQQVISQHLQNTKGSRMNKTDRLDCLRIRQQRLDPVQPHCQIFPVKVVQGCRQSFGCLQNSVQRLSILPGNELCLLHHIVVNRSRASSWYHRNEGIIRTKYSTNEEKLTAIRLPMSC